VEKGRHFEHLRYTVRRTVLSTFPEADIFRRTEGEKSSSTKSGKRPALCELELEHTFPEANIFLRTEAEKSSGEQEKRKEATVLFRCRVCRFV
jgi:hypothetical protein